MSAYVSPILIVLLALAGAAQAQSVTGKTVQAVSGQAIRLGVHAGIKPDCSPGPLPEVRIVTPPANGVFQVLRAKGKINRPGKCPLNAEIPVQAAFYQSRAGFAGTDSVTYEVLSASGAKNSYTIAITVTAQGKSPAKRVPGERDI